MYLTFIFHLHQINLLFALAGLTLFAATLVLLWDYKQNDSALYRQWIEPHVWLVIILATAGGVASTLFYSEILRFVPCSLCWLQRIALYPQLLLVLAAVRMRDRVFFPVYGMVLSGFGLVVALYHYAYQSAPKELRESGMVPCLTDGSADCAEKIMNVFGFITFPLLSAGLFFFLIVIYLHLQRSSALTDTKALV